MFAISNSPNSRNDEVVISKMILRRVKTNKSAIWGSATPFFTLYIKIAMACSLGVGSVGSFAQCKSPSTSICCHRTQRVVLVLELFLVSWHQKNDKNARQFDSM